MTQEALKRVAEKLRRTGASIPAPEVTGTIEGSVVTGLCIALALVESEAEALAQPEQEPVALPCCGYTDASAVKWNPFNGVVQCHNCGQTYTPAQRTEQCKYPDCKCPTENPCLKGLAQLEQEPVAWPCEIEEADFGQDTITLKMLTSEYFIRAGKHWLSTTPPAQPEQRKPLTNEQITTISNKGAEGGAEDSIYRFVRAIEAAHGIKENT